MPTQFTLPPMGESIKKGTVAKILVSTGDTIEEDQPVLELETDKAVQEVPSTVSGTVGQILVKEGDQIEIGAPIFDLEGGTTAASNGQSTSTPAPQSTSSSSGEREKATQADSEDSSFANTSGIATGGPNSSAAASNGNAHASGTGSLNGQPTAAPSAPQLAETTRELIPAAPSTRRLAREMSVDIRQVKGSGPDGRISAGDIQNYARGGASAEAPASAQSTLVGGLISFPLPDFEKFGRVERQPMSGIRRATAEQMQRAWSSVPHVTQFDKADITEIEKLRKQYGKAAEAAGGKLTITAIILKIAVGALKKFPQFNASLDAEKGEIVLKKYFHIGVAVDTDRGLLVPVIRDVDQKNIVELAVELGQIAERARSKKIGLDEMTGGCFTITNLGGIGGTHFTPIVNVPEVAILGLSRGGMEPVWNGESFQPRQMLPMSLSYDHRAIDGADGARFLRWIATALEQPFLMALEG